ncbi:MAG: RsmD family RNA methyltransferase [Bacteroidia bacterium]|nr:RsmD family RNA methyltransferase [Bacteroidia bacterium]
MRIIGGKKGGITIQAPAGLPVRPTTDRAKESLFNILANQYHWENLVCLDLFSGTGNITYELASRGVAQVQSVDRDFGCVKFIKETCRKHEFSNVEVRKQDVFAFLKSVPVSFDLIFADPPYGLDRIAELPGIIIGTSWLKPSGLLIIEHGSNLDMQHFKGFFEARKYGQSTFSFFRNQE